MGSAKSRRRPRRRRRSCARCRWRLDATLVAIFLEMTIDTSLLLPIWHNQLPILCFMAFLTLGSIAKTAHFFALFLVYHQIQLVFQLQFDAIFFSFGRCPLNHFFSYCHIFYTDDYSLHRKMKSAIISSMICTPLLLLIFFGPSSKCIIMHQKDREKWRLFSTIIVPSVASRQMFLLE